MDTELILGALALYALSKHSSPAAATSSTASSGSVNAGTTTQVVTNKATATASTVTEISNDAVIVATDGVQILDKISNYFGSDPSNDDGS